MSYSSRGHDPLRAVFLFLLIVCTSLGTAFDAVAQTEMIGPVNDSLLIRNVTLIDQKGDGEDRVVSILIRDRKLDVITEEDVSTNSAALALDGQQGILLGRLEVGQPANFLILSGDPREEVSVLLDTATYATFAIRDGSIVRNGLPRTFDADDQPKRSGWLAYTPPPMALPSVYLDTTKWNRWDTKPVSGIFLAGLVLDRMNWQDQDGIIESEFGDLSEFDGGEIRGLRFGVVGTLNFPNPWVYTIFAATSAFDKGFDTDEDDDVQFFDWRLDIPTFAETTLSVGKQKEPISMERSMGMIYLPLQERTAVSDALLPGRNVGVVLSGGALNSRMTWAGGIFNDWLDTGDQLSDSATQFIGRITGLPFVSADESNLLHLGAGFRYTNAREGLLFATEPEFNQSPSFVETDILAADSSSLYNLEASWRRGPVWVHGEYVLNNIDAPTLNNPDFSGYHITGSWILTGEMRGYNRKGGIFSPVPVSKSVYQNGRGAWELAARWSNIDLNDGSVEGGDMDILSVGLNWWLTPFFNASFNYRWVSLDRFGETGDSQGFNSRIVLMLE